MALREGSKIELKRDKRPIINRDSTGNIFYERCLLALDRLYSILVS